MANAFNLSVQLQLQGPKNLNNVVKQINSKLSSGINANINIKISKALQANVTSLNKSFKAFNTTLQQTNAIGQSTNKTLNAMAAAVNALRQSTGSINTATGSIGKAKKAMDAATTSAEQFGKAAGLAFKRYSAFAGITGGIFALTRAITDGVSEAITFQKELVTLAQVTDTSLNNTKKLASEVTRLAVGFGVSSKALIDVSTILAQAGLTIEDTRLALEALAKSSLAPSFNDINKTAQGSIAILAQFGIKAKDLEKALGSINEVSAQFAVEAEDIISAIRLAGGVFASTSKGVSEGTDALNEFISVFTSVRATTRESAESIATGLRTIFTRIQRRGTIDELRQFGVELQDLEGNFVGPFEAVNRLGEALNKLDPRSERFASITEELGGYRQLGKVIPLIQQTELRVKALKVAQEGYNSLSKDSDTAQLALANRISKVREEFLALIRAISETSSFQALIDIGLKTASTFIKVADSFKEIIPYLTLFASVKAVQNFIPLVRGFSGAFKTQGKNQGGQIERFARGGLVPGQGNTDSVPALLTPGEFVIRKKAVEQIGTDKLKDFNKYNTGDVVKKNVPSALAQQAYRNIYQKSSKQKDIELAKLGLTSKDVEVPDTVNSPAALDAYFQQNKSLAATLAAGFTRKGATAAQKAEANKLKAAEKKAKKEADTNRKISFGVDGAEPMFGVLAFQKGKSFKGIKSAYSFKTENEEKANRLAARLGIPADRLGSFRSSYSANLVDPIIESKFEEDFRTGFAELTEGIIAKYTAEIEAFKGQKTSQKVGAALEKALSPSILGFGFEAMISAGANSPLSEDTKQTFDFPVGKSKEGLERLFGKIPDSVRFLDSKRSLSTAFAANKSGTIPAKAINQIIKDGIAIKPLDKVRRAKTLEGPIERGNIIDSHHLAEAEKRKQETFRAAKGGSPPGVDNVPALLTPGEFVINKKAAQRIGYGKLEELNQIDKFNKGGAVRMAAGGKTPRVTLPKSAGGASIAVPGIDTLLQTYAASIGTQQDAIKYLNIELKQLAAQLVKNGVQGKALEKGIRTYVAALNKGAGTFTAQDLAIKAGTDLQRKQTAKKRAAPFKNVGADNLGLFLAAPLLGQIPGPAGGALSGAAGGAAVGAQLGPVAAAAGAIIGALTGLESSLNDAATKIREAAIDVALKDVESSLDSFSKSKALKDLEKAFTSINDARTAALSASNVPGFARGVDNVSRLSGAGGISEFERKFLNEEVGLLGGISTTLKALTLSRENVIGSASVLGGVGAGKLAGQAADALGLKGFQENIAKDLSAQGLSFANRIALELEPIIQADSRARDAQIAEAQKKGNLDQLIESDEGLRNNIANRNIGTRAQLLALQPQIDRGDKEAIAKRNELIGEEVLKKKESLAVDQKVIDAQNAMAASQKAYQEAQLKSNLAMAAFAQAIDDTSNRLDALAEGSRFRQEKFGVAVNGARGRFDFRRPIEGLLSNPLGNKQSALQGRFGEIRAFSGDTPALKTMEKSIIALKDFSTSIRARLVEATAGSEAEGEGAERKIVDKFINDELGKKLPAQIINEMKLGVKEAFGNDQTPGVEKLEGQALSESIDAIINSFSKTLGRFPELTAKVEKAFIEAQTNLREAFNTTVELQLDQNDKLRKVGELRAQNELNLAKLLGENLNVDQLAKPIEQQVLALADSLDPEAILKNIRGGQSRLDKNFDKNFNPKDFEDPTKRAEIKASLDLATKIEENKKALEILANDTTRLAAIQEKISNAQRAREERRNVVGGLLGSDAKELIRQQQLMVGILRGDKFRGDDFNKAIEVLRNVPVDDPAKREEFIKNFIKGQAGNIDLPPQFAAAFGKAQDDPGVAPLIGELKKAQEVQIAAAQALARLVDPSVAFNAGVENFKQAALELGTVLDNKDFVNSKFIGAVFENTNNPQEDNFDIFKNMFGLDFIKGGAANVKKFAGGGQVNGAYKGGDSVLAHLTPGEFVVNRAATQKNKGLLQALNGGGHVNGVVSRGIPGVRGYIDGGEVVTPKQADFLIKQTVEALNKLGFNIPDNLVNNVRNITAAELKQAGQGVLDIDAAFKYPELIPGQAIKKAVGNEILVNASKKITAKTILHELSHAIDLFRGSQIGTKDTFASKQPGNSFYNAARAAKPAAAAELLAKGKTPSVGFAKYFLGNEEIFARGLPENILKLDEIKNLKLPADSALRNTSTGSSIPSALAAKQTELAKSLGISASGAAAGAKPSALGGLAKGIGIGLGLEAVRQNTRGTVVGDVASAGIIAASGKFQTPSTALEAIRLTSQVLTGKRADDLYTASSRTRADQEALVEKYAPGTSTEKGLYSSFYDVLLGTNTPNAEVYRLAQEFKSKEQLAAYVESRNAQDAAANKAAAAKRAAETEALKRRPRPGVPGGVPLKFAKGGLVPGYAGGGRVANFRGNYDDIRKSRRESYVSGQEGKRKAYLAGKDARAAAYAETIPNKFTGDILGARDEKDIVNELRYLERLPPTDANLKRRRELTKELNLMRKARGFNPLGGKVPGVDGPLAGPAAGAAFARNSEAAASRVRDQGRFVRDQARATVNRVRDSIPGNREKFAAQHDAALDRVKVGQDKFIEKDAADRERRRKMMEVPAFATGGSVGTDTVPAMLTPGEFVINRRAAQQNLGLLQQINAQKFQTGGQVGSVNTNNNGGNSLNIAAQFEQASKSLQAALNPFIQAAQSLEKSSETLSKIPTKIEATMTINPVQVIINGADVLAGLEPGLQSMVISAVEQAISSRFNLDGSPKEL